MASFRSLDELVSRLHAQLGNLPVGVSAATKGPGSAGWLAFDATVLAAERAFAEGDEVTIGSSRFHVWKVDPSTGGNRIRLIDAAGTWYAGSGGTVTVRRPGRRNLYTATSQAVATWSRAGADCGPPELAPCDCNGDRTWDVLLPASATSGDDCDLDLLGRFASWCDAPNPDAAALALESDAPLCVGGSWDPPASGPVTGYFVGHLGVATSDPLAADLVLPYCPFDVLDASAGEFTDRWPVPTESVSGTYARPVHARPARTMSPTPGSMGSAVPGGFSAPGSTSPSGRRQARCRRRG